MNDLDFTVRGCTCTVLEPEYWIDENCPVHGKTPPKPSTTSKPVDSNIEQLFLDRILFIGNEIPDMDKHRNKFVLLGTPQDLMEDIQQLIDKQVLEERNKYRVLPPTVCPECGIKSGQMKRHLVKDHDYRYSEDSPNMPVKALEGSGKPPAQNKDALQTNNKEKKQVEL